MPVIQQIVSYSVLFAVSLGSTIVLLRQYLRGDLLDEAPVTACARPRVASRSRPRPTVVRSRAGAHARRAHRRTPAAAWHSRRATRHAV